MPDRRKASRIRHAMFEMVMARVCAIACGHEDAIDLDRLQHDPLMNVAGGTTGPLGSKYLRPGSAPRTMNQHIISPLANPVRAQAPDGITRQRSAGTSIYRGAM
jgi:hypothetical protein